MAYTIIGYAHEGIGHSNVSIEKNTYEDALDEVEPLLYMSSVIYRVVILDEKGNMISEHY